MTYQGEPPSNSTPLDEGGDTTATTINRREHVRVKPDDRNRLAATLASGSDIRLIDLSRGGAQFECERRFLPNASVSLRLRTRDGEVLVNGRVVRSRIVRLASGGLGYLVGVAFSNPLQKDPGEDEAPAPARQAPANPSPEAAAPAAAVAASASPGDRDLAPARPVTSSPVDPVPTPVDTAADITAEEALAFESGLQFAPAMLMVTASVDTTSEQLQDMFNGNDW